MRRILIPIGPMTDDHCDPQCPHRIGSVPNWQCRLFEDQLMYSEETGLALRCWRCRQAEQLCAPKMEHPREERRVRGIRR